VNNNYSNKQDAYDKYRMKSQQMFPGFPGGVPDRGEDQEDRQRGRRQGQQDRDQPPTTPPFFEPQGPGMGEMPRMAPPSFTPEAPQMDQRQMGRQGQQFGYGPQFGPEFAVRPRDLRNCMFRFTYFWLFNGNNFWFYPTYVDRQAVQGFRWRRNRWEFDRINLRRIFFFRCF